MTMLMELYCTAIALPLLEPGENEIQHQRKQLSVRTDPDFFYWEIYDPFKQEDLVGHPLDADLLDIYDDLLDGIFEYEEDRVDNAIFEWRFGLNHH